MIQEVQIDELRRRFDVPDVFVGQFTRHSSVALTVSQLPPKMASLCFNYCSISKLVTGLLCLRLIQEDFFQLDTRVKSILPSFQREQTTIEELLRHLSGIQDNPAHFESIEEQLEVDFLSSIDWQEPHQFRYSDHGYMILQLVIETLLKQPFETAAARFVFHPLNLSSAHYLSILPVSETGERYAVGYDALTKMLPQRYGLYPYPAAAGLWGDGEDLLRLMLEIADGYQGNSQLGISATHYQQLTTPKIETWLGLSCFLDRVGDKVEISSMGWGKGAQCLTACYPASSEGLVVLTNKDPGVSQMDAFCGAVYRLWIQEMEEASHE